MKQISTCQRVKNSVKELNAAVEAFGKTPDWLAGITEESYDGLYRMFMLMDDCKILGDIMLASKAIDHREDAVKDGSVNVWKCLLELGLALCEGLEEEAFMYTELSVKAWLRRSSVCKGYYRKEWLEDTIDYVKNGAGWDKALAGDVSTGDSYTDSTVKGLAWILKNIKTVNGIAERLRGAGAGRAVKGGADRYDKDDYSEVTKSPAAARDFLTNLLSGNMKITA
jgi:hypothetical protein